MPVIYRFNSWFEYEIAAWPFFQPNMKLKKIQSWLEKIFFVFSNQGDIVYCETPLPEDLRQYWLDAGLQIGQYANQTTDLPNFSLIEWGKTSRIHQGKLEYDSVQIQQARELNSKIKQATWKRRLTNNSCNTEIIKNRIQLERYIKEIGFPLVLKNEFSMAGREFQIISDNKEWQQSQVSFKHPLVVEKWVSRDKDFSLLFEVQPNTLRFLSMTEMQLTSKGHFTGIKLSKTNPFLLEEALSFLHTALKNVNYIGPISLDGFYFTENEKPKFQICSEINFRYTMGRILYDFSSQTNHTLVLEIVPNHNKNTYQSLLQKKLDDPDFILLTPLHDHNKEAFSKMVILRSLESAPLFPQ